MEREEEDIQQTGNQTQHNSFEDCSLFSGVHVVYELSLTAPYYSLLSIALSPTVVFLQFNFTKCLRDEHIHITYISDSNHSTFHPQSRWFSALFLAFSSHCNLFRYVFCLMHASDLTILKLTNIFSTISRCWGYLTCRNYLIGGIGLFAELNLGTDIFLARLCITDVCHDTRRWPKSFSASYSDDEVFCCLFACPVNWNGQHPVVPCCTPREVHVVLHRRKCYVTLVSGWWL